jgi:hypothetical protein
MKWSGYRSQLAKKKAIIVVATPPVSYLARRASERHGLSVTVPSPLTNVVPAVNQMAPNRVLQIARIAIC